MVERPDKEIELRRQARKKELARRTKEVQYWMQRDSKRVKLLRKVWAERDKEWIENRHRVFDYICTLCNRPFVTPRKMNSRSRGYCFSCTKFERNKRYREYYRKHPGLNKTYAERVKAKKQQAPIIPEEPPQRLEPQVVWSLEESGNAA